MVNISLPSTSDASSEIFVSLDLETTGFNSAVDEIIEIGAIKFQGETELGRFNTFVRAMKPIPAEVQALTGITQLEVDGAPSFSSVADALATFLGSHPIVGQNISFDLTFLANVGVRPTGMPLDTMDLATVLLPSQGSYGLGELIRTLGLTSLRPHRAIADAEMAMNVLNALRKRLLELDPGVLATITRLSARTDWPMKTIFQKAFEAKQLGQETIITDAGLDGIDLKTLAQRLAPNEPLVANRVVQPIDIEQLASFIEPGGIFEQTIAGFENRPEQIKMLKAVSNAFNTDSEIIVEAGTGTGKSLAYLLPSLMYSMKNNAQVVVATSTINLQEQLTGKDVPDLMKSISRVMPEETERVKTMQLKGADNYICLKRLISMIRSQDLNAKDVRFAAKMLIWLTTTSSGDKRELHLVGPENTLWEKVSAKGIRNGSMECPFFNKGLCFLNANRRKAASANILIINHALLLADAKRGGSLLPSFEHLIVDEAHNLEVEATRQLGSEVRQSQVLTLLDSVTSNLPTGIVTSLRTTLASGLTQHPNVPMLRDLLDKTVDAAGAARMRVGEFFRALLNFTNAHSEEITDYERKLLIKDSTRKQPDWSKLEISSENLYNSLHSLKVTLERVEIGFEPMLEQYTSILEPPLMEVHKALENLDDLSVRVQSMVTHPEKDFIYWSTIEANGAGVALQSAPLRVGQLLRKAIFDDKKSVVLTSATMTTGNDFSFIKQRVGMEGADELLLGSPFDYKRAALIYLPTDIPEPGAIGYQPSLEEAVASAVIASNGRALVLFTSHSSLKTVRGPLQKALSPYGIRVLAQGLDGTPNQILNDFKANSNAVLLGTSSFWEGVDIAGETLSLLILARLPFSVPSEPIFAGRAELYDDPFNQYAVPQAILRFKQGFGRLIRRKTDRGVVVILDRRVHSKGYGPAFLSSIPVCTRKSGPLAGMPGEISAWLKKS